jgi:hypothetical protein
MSNTAPRPDFSQKSKQTPKHVAKSQEDEKQKTETSQNE